MTLNQSEKKKRKYGAALLVTSSTVKTKKTNWVIEIHVTVTSELFFYLKNMCYCLNDEKVAGISSKTSLGLCSLLCQLLTAKYEKECPARSLTH